MKGSAVRIRASAPRFRDFGYSALAGSAARDRSTRALGGLPGVTIIATVPFVFLAALGAGTVYLLRSRRPVAAAGVVGISSRDGIRPGSIARRRLVGIRGWLLVYVLGLAAELAHGLALTIGSLIIYRSPRWRACTRSYRCGRC